MSIFEVFPGPSANEQGPDKTSDFDTFYTVRDEQLNLLTSTINIMEMLALNLFLPTFQSLNSTRKASKNNWCDSLDITKVL